MYSVISIAECAFSGLPLSVAIGNFGELLESISLVAHRESGNKLTILWL